MMEINGMKVVDATKPMKIHVIDRDVKAGDNKNPSSCAAARAAIREGACTEARVHIGRTYLRQGNKWLRYKTPKALHTEIVAFDRGAVFQPGTFTLSPPSPADRLNRGKAMGTTTSKTRPKGTHKKRPTPRHVTGVRQYGANR